MVGFLLAPFLVVIRITPPAPLDPYIAVAEASFKTSIDSISLGCTLDILPPCIPSIIISGSLAALIELTPRIRIDTLEFGEASLLTISTPVNLQHKVYRLLV